MGKWVGARYDDVGHPKVPEKMQKRRNMYSLRVTYLEYERYENLKQTSHILRILKQRRDGRRCRQGVVGLRLPAKALLVGD